MTWRALLILLTAANVYAEQHMVEYLLPRGGSRGASVDVVITGQYMQDPREIIFYSPGIKATNIKPGTKPAEEVKATLEIAADCMPRLSPPAR